MNKILLYFLLLMLPGIVGSGCLGSGSSSQADPVSQSSQTATLSASALSLALSVNDTALSASLTGSPRTFSVTNAGGAAATSVAYTVSPALPTGTTISPANCGDLAPAATCVLTITPGNTASAPRGDTNPTAVTLAIAGSKTNTLSLSIDVLTYGSVHQAGYVFAVDDTAPNTGSIGGKVAALADQAPAYPNGMIWSSNGNGATSADVAHDDIPGTYETSTNPPCNGNLDGACTSGLIVAFYSLPDKNPPVNRSYYAAGLCTATMGGFSDWYLPAICEMTYENGGAGTGCGTRATPTAQNMQYSLAENGNVGSFSGYYWSSTEFSSLPGAYAFGQYFDSGGDTFQAVVDHQYPLGVRCARAMTN